MSRLFCNLAMLLSRVTTAHRDLAALRLLSPTVVLLALLLVLTAACSLRGDNTNMVLGSEVILSGQAMLTCSQECADRGQCGTADAGEMILVNSPEPAVSNHNMAISAGTLVTIDHAESRQVLQISNSESLNIDFYLVNIPDRGFGWTAGWCIGQ